MIIALVGLIGSGKGTVAEYLKEKYNFKVITMGDLVREEAKKRNILPTRINLQNLSERLRKKDKLYFIKKANKKIKSNLNFNWVIDGIRLPIGIKFFKEKYGKDFVVLLVDTSKKIRFKRIKERNRPGAPKTYKEFLKHEEREINEFNLNETLNYFDFKIKNNKSLDDLHKEIDSLLIKFKNSGFL